MHIHFKRVAGVGSGNSICFWKFKGLASESITALTISNYSLNRQLSYLGTKTRVELWDGIKNLIQNIDNKPGEYDKEFMKIKFRSDDNLVLGKILRLHMLQ